MVFSIDTLNESLDYKFPSLIEESDNNLDFSFFDINLRLLVEEQKNFNINLLSKEKIVEKIKTIDIKSLLLNIFDWFIDSINKLTDLFISSIIKFINSNNKKISKYRRELKSYDNKLEYYGIQYNYTNIDTYDVASFGDYESDITNEYINLLNELEKLKSAKTPMEVSDTLYNIMKNIQYNSVSLDTIRGKILGKSRGVNVEDYPKELFKFFRKGKDTPISKKTYSADAIKYIASVYFSYDRQTKYIRREANKLTSVAKARKKDIKAKDINDYIPNTSNLDDSIMNSFNIIIIEECSKIRNICDIYRMFYSAKLDAIREYTASNVGILAQAIIELKKNKGGNDNAN
jgi:hypothetical protein